MIAEELMTRDPVCISTTAKIRDAVELLQSLEVRHLPVVNDENELVGMLSDRDLRGLAFPDVVADDVQAYVRRTLNAQVTSVMTSDVLSVDVEADLGDVVDLMLVHKVGAVPVVDRDRGLVGIISYVDVLREAQRKLD